MSSSRQKPEDSADGCRVMASSDRLKAAATANDHMRASFERSAQVWTARANLLDRLEANFHARAAANVAEHRRPRKLEADNG